jgi:hypothetical protein
MTLYTLLTTINAHLITCLKLDVEGVESVIIRQLQQIPAFLLPASIVFEYGGGSTKQDQKAGWSEIGINDTLSCFRVLKYLHYRTMIIIDSSPESNERIFDLAEVNILPDILFHPRSVYGNAICLLENISNTTWIERICSLYRDNDIQPPKFMPKMGRLARCMWNLRCVINRFYK